ncbi:1-acyl-sn-glycerol-3-phosphate acyltransferase [Peribacillus psychrosaccharolyticus]|uniref:1-acyl-sn-glycerol-3-phosphate acyltransferase n=1 Tax=Peribacillus psychrosaccharolyticus TaxID=1407 RepID=A0A974NLV6_PERPY|nr:lysophospholipid acyltransferase family protein [Peribacillus psychrosaccharolyticus]MEC2056737.1 lysophospholipid acyltransferase family protein [Peribacillus psychrosaccharolyticus]MED3746191.1 lysophospholipid acyltransferase family protein [Peribacillus psychrosaccharolyticus]QQT00138.1 1-acyl-sn-glycerol-3-phosphate acyltransferase [Peribacillus psychrosaccharolyticus]
MNFYTFAKNVVKIGLSPVYRIKASGKEHFPKEGGVLICANHINNLDPLAVGTTSPRDIHFMAKEELFRAPVLKGIMPKINAFPVKRGLSDREALRKGLAILKDDRVLGLFPEGTRSKNGELGEGLSGAGFFALRSQAHIVPCAVIGPYSFLGKVKVVYGKPIDFQPYRDQKVSADVATKVIMAEIQKLISENK